MALTVTGMGGLAMIGGMLILGQIVGSYDLSVILQNRELIQESPLYLPALILILLGCFTKSAQFPFHFWLPHAMAAPTPVSAYLHSATMVKAGIFLMARMWPVLSGTPEWFVIVTGAGLITMVLGAVIALFKHDLKALLAFSTVSHLGLITMLLGTGTAFGAMAAMFHILNHATFKAALFMSAGIVDHETHTRDIRRLGGLRHLMPITFTIATIASLSMAGIPFLNGFLSKEMMLEEANRTVLFNTPMLVPVLATIGSLFSAAYCFRLIGIFKPLLKGWAAAPRPEAKDIFDTIIAFFVALSRKLIHPAHDGAFSRYAAIMLGFVTLAGYYAWRTGTLDPATRVLQPAGAVEIAGWLMLVAATGGLVLMHRNRLLSLILMGVVGLMVSVGFVFFSAPDLAMTQITVDVVTIILLLLALNFLPKTTPIESSSLRRLRDGAFGRHASDDDGRADPRADADCVVGRLLHLLAGPQPAGRRVHRGACRFDCGCDAIYGQRV